MGFLDSLFGSSSAPTDKQIASTVKALETRHGEPVRRYEAADKLARWGTPEALLGLLRRYTFNAPAEMSDEEEKAHVAELLEKAGRNAVVPIEKHVLSEAEVAWPLRILERILPVEEFCPRVCALMGRLDTHFDRVPERKVDFIHAMTPHASDPAVADATLRFLEDTDDSVRLAAIELLLVSARESDREAMLDCLLASEDRPRVTATILSAFSSRSWSVGSRSEAIAKLIPKDLGIAITKDGFVKQGAK